MLAYEKCAYEMFQCVHAWKLICFYFTSLYDHTKNRNLIPIMFFIAPFPSPKAIYCARQRLVPGLTHGHHVQAVHRHVPRSPVLSMTRSARRSSQSRVAAAARCPRGPGSRQRSRQQVPGGRRGRGAEWAWCVQRLTTAVAHGGSL